MRAKNDDDDEEENEEETEMHLKKFRMKEMDEKRIECIYAREKSGITEKLL